MNPFHNSGVKRGLLFENTVLALERLISIIVVLALVINLRASFRISSILPIGVLFTFIAMRQFGVVANIVAFQGLLFLLGLWSMFGLCSLKI